MNYYQAGLQLLAENQPINWVVRSDIAGRAWHNERLIHAPEPKTAKSFEVFAHEIGHIIDNNLKDPSWKRELMASEFALTQFKRFGLKLPNEVKQKIYGYITYSICQALNRGMKKIPVEARKYCYGRIDRGVTLLRGGKRATRYYAKNY